MAISYDEVKDLHGRLEQRDMRRHTELRALRRYWQGDYWRETDSGRSAVKSVADLFRDLKGTSDLGPDLKLVHNLLQEACVKYQTFLSPVPMIRTFVDPPFSEQRRAQATRKERALYGTWSTNRMSQRMAEIGWYLPLMGDCFPCIWPDFEKKCPRLIVRSPEIAHPVRSMDGDSLDQVVFRWEQDERTVMRQYPRYQPTADKPRSTFNPFQKNSGGERKVEILEYSDSNEYAIWADEQKLRSITHGLGFNLFGQMGFIPVPGEPFNHGAVEQIVSLVEMGNAAYSLQFQAMLEGVFPTLVLINPDKAPEQIVRGAGAVIPLREGGDAKYLTAPAQQLAFQTQFLRDNHERVMEGTGIPPAAMGQSPATSIVTGAAVDSLLGAGTGSTVEMVQGTQIGPELVAWNEKALIMFRTLYRDDTIQLYGYVPETAMDVKGRRFSVTFKGSEIVGSTRNEVVFQPHIGDHEKLVMMLQARGDNLVSRKHAREQIGIADNDAMVEEILTEQIEDGLLGMILQEFAAQPTAEGAQTAEREVAAFIDNATMPAPHPLLNMGIGPNGAPPVAAGPGGQPALPVGPPQPGPQPQPGAPPGAPPAAAAAAPAAVQPQTGVVTANEAQAAFQTVQGIVGRVFLIGEIAVRGQTSGDIEVAVTNPADQKTLTAGLPQYQGRLAFRHVETEPTERFIEVTPGQTARPGGEAQRSPEELHHVFVQ